jgi:hypothetical protein
MTSGQDVSEFLDTFGLVKSYFFKFFEKIQLKKNWKKKRRKKMSWCSDSPEDEAISLFAGLLANPDMTLSLRSKEEATLRALLQTSPTRARGLWSSVFFSIEVNPNTVWSGPTGYYSSSLLSKEEL